MKTLLKTLLRLYLLASLLLSLAFHVSGDYAIIRHRAPFLVCELAFSVVQSDGDGLDQHGNPIGYSFDVVPGERVRTLLIYNPLTNYSDDIIARFDF